MGTTGVIFNIQRFCIHDGPGIRTTVFLKGCPLRCWWCHNPEGQKPQPELSLIPARCVRCGYCRTVCPQQVAEAAGGNGRAAATRAVAEQAHAGPGEGPAHASPVPVAARCTLCGACVEACPTEARQMVGRTMSIGQVLAEVLKDRIFYDESGGGVTFSGGEPLGQGWFLSGLLKACRAEEVHTALDTCGFAPKAELLELAARSDLVLYDLKSFDDQLHRQHTGVSNAVILDNLEALAQQHANIWVRIPLIPGVNDAPDELEAMARFVSRLKGVRQVNLLGYHALGEHKHPARSAPSRAPRPAPPGPEQLDQAAERFRRFGLAVCVGG